VVLNAQFFGHSLFVASFHLSCFCYSFFVTCSIPILNCTNIIGGLFSCRSEAQAHLVLTLYSLQVNILSLYHIGVRLRTLLIHRILYRLPYHACVRNFLTSLCDWMTVPKTSGVIKMRDDCQCLFRRSNTATSALCSYHRRHRAASHVTTDKLRHGCAFASRTHSGQSEHVVYPARALKPESL
jgi:hypothetical protein